MPTAQDETRLAVPVRAARDPAVARGGGETARQPAQPLAGADLRDAVRAARGPGTARWRSARLQCGDVDLDRDVLLIRNSKFGKSRLVPFGPRLSRRLHGYLELREQEGWPIAGSAPLFSWDGKRAISTNTIRNVFREDLLPRLALAVPAGTAKPRVHGLRHSFAVRTLLRWYREGLDPAARLHYLSTFLGHVNPQSTAVYLTMTSELLAEANRRFEALAPTPPEARP